MKDWIRSRSDKPLHHGVALLALSLAIALRWSTYLLSGESLGDENIYLQAFQSVASGGEAREVSGFYYPDSFAQIGSWLLESLGFVGTRTLLRVSSVLGLAATVWIAFCLWPARWILRLGASVLYISVAPAVYYGVETGNISLAVNGMVLVALVAWSTRPVLAGLLLGTSTAIKPLAPLAIAALLFHRPVPPTRKNLVAAIMGGILAAAVLLMNPEYLTTSSQAIGRLPFIRSISLNRILVLLGIEIGPAVVAVILGLLIVVVARRLPMSRQTLLCFGGCAAVLAVPVIWSHTLLLTLPLQVLALTRAISRRHQSPAERTPAPTTRETWSRYEVAFVALAVAALQLTNGIGPVDNQALWFQLIVLTGAYLAAPLLMGYVLVTDPEPQET